MTRIAIVDDDEEDRKILLDNIHRYALENQLELDVDVYIDGLGIVSPYQGGYEIIFLDVQMQYQDGLATARIIRERDQDVIIIFLTHFAQYAIHGYSVGAMNFIIKPISYVMVREELSRAIARINKKLSTTILLHNADGIVKIPLADVYFIETVGRNLMVHTTSGNFEINDSLTNLKKTLNDPRFFRSHRAYLVNMYFVERVKDGNIYIKNSMIPLSRYRQKEFNDFLFSLFSETM